MKRFIYLSFQLVNKPNRCVTLNLSYYRWKIVLHKFLYLADMSNSGRMLILGRLGYCGKCFYGQKPHNHLLSLISWIVIQELQFFLRYVGKSKLSLMAPEAP